MPALLATLLGGLIEITSTLVGRALIALGISAITFTGMSTSLAWLKTQAVDAFQLLPADIVALLAYMKVGTSISIIFSAIVARQLLNGLSSDSVKRWVTK